MVRALAFLLLAAPALATSLARELPTHAGKFGEPPLPSVELPAKEDDKACVCFAANMKAFGATSGGFDMASTDNDDWHFTCNGDTIGEMWTPCFPSSGSAYEDNFGDKFDPNNPICP